MNRLSFKANLEMTDAFKRKHPGLKSIESKLRREIQEQTIGDKNTTLVLDSTHNDTLSLSKLDDRSQK